jgi:hypothetical protein
LVQILLRKFDNDSDILGAVLNSLMAVELENQIKTDLGLSVSMGTSRRGWLAHRVGQASEARREHQQSKECMP